MPHPGIWCATPRFLGAACFESCSILSLVLAVLFCYCSIPNQAFSKAPILVAEKERDKLPDADETIAWDMSQEKPPEKSLE
jgi:hypothetical protein